MARTTTGTPPSLERLGAEPTLPSGTPSRAPGVGGASSAGRVLVRRLPSLRGVARFAPVMAAVRRFADDGGLVLGICNGFQVPREANLLPGALRPNASLEFVATTSLRLERRHALHEPRRAGQTLTIPIKPAVLLRGRGLLHEPSAQIVLRYEQNPNGSVAATPASERARERLRPDAAPQARGRPAAGLDRRRARARLACRRGARAPAHGGLSPSASASAGRLARPARSRSRSRPRNVTGPRRAEPPVV